MTCVPLKVASTPDTATESPTTKPCAVAVVSVAIFDVRALFVTRTGEPECTKLFTVLPPTVNWFVNALASVPHLMDTPVIEASTGNGHFNETERTPADAVSEPGLNGFEAISTMPLPHNFC